MLSFAFVREEMENALGSVERMEKFMWGGYGTWWNYLLQQGAKKR